jgi:hypothetical protein
MVPQSDLPKERLTFALSLEQVEKLLKTQEPSSIAVSPEATKPPNVSFEPTSTQIGASTANFNVTNPSIAIAGDRDMDRWRFNGDSPQPGNVETEFNFNNNIPMGMNSMDNSFTWEMIGLGLEEPLPPQDTIDEL